MPDIRTPGDILRIELNERLDRRDALRDCVQECDRMRITAVADLEMLGAEIRGLEDALLTLAGPQPLSP